MKWVVGGGDFDREVKAAFSSVNVDELWDLPQQALAIVQTIAGSDFKITRLNHNPSFGSGRSISFIGQYKGTHHFMVRMWDDESSYRHLPSHTYTDSISDQGAFNV